MSCQLKLLINKYARTASRSTISGQWCIMMFMSAVAVNHLCAMTIVRRMYFVTIDAYVIVSKYYKSVIDSEPKVGRIMHLPVRSQPSRHGESCQPPGSATQCCASSAAAGLGLTRRCQLRVSAVPCRKQVHQNQIAMCTCSHRAFVTEQPTMQPLCFRNAFVNCFFR